MDSGSAPNLAIGLVIAYAIGVGELVGLVFGIYWTKHAPDTVAFYRRVRSAFQRVSSYVTIAVFFYLALDIASQAFTTVGVPYLSCTFNQLTATDVGPLLGGVRPAELVLVGTVVLAIGFVFFVAAKFKRYRSWIDPTRDRSVFLKTYLPSMGFAGFAALVVFVIPQIGRGSISDIKPSVCGSTSNIPANIDLLREMLVFGVTSVVCLVLGIVFLRRIVSPEARRAFQDFAWSIVILGAVPTAMLVASRSGYLDYGTPSALVLTGSLFVSGFLSLTDAANMGLAVEKRREAIFTLLAGSAFSLALAALLSLLFDGLRSIPNFATHSSPQLILACLILILPYELQYHRVWRYQYGHWWSGMRPFAVAVALVSLTLVGLIPPDVAFVLPPGSLKLLAVAVIISAMWFLPWLLAKLVLHGKRFLLPSEYGVLFLKIEPGADIRVRDHLQINNLAHSMISTIGVYDLEAGIEAFDESEFWTKLRQIREIPGVLVVDAGRTARELSDV